ncbi:hypothetical protein D6783_05475 [Candidatus Woesearchaeota archaeon]|nr:MAG: hypothetical protein D6783_05475 [Candidatus Woesearchaeota archaeon]
MVWFQVNVLSLVFLVLGLVAFPAGFVSAQTSSGQPEQFYGTVTVNGGPAPDGLVVKAVIDGATYLTKTKAGKYGYDPVFLIDDPRGDRNGKEIVFYVQDVDTGERAIFNSGSASGDYDNTHRLDLDVNGVNLGGSSSSGGGGGGGGGGGRFVASTTSSEDAGDGEESGVCVPDWTCSDWLDCLNGFQKRVCVDSNRCQSLENKPAEERECEIPPELRASAPVDVQATGGEDDNGLPATSEGSTTGLRGVTGFVVGSPLRAGASIALLLLIVAGIAFFIFAKKKKS